MKAGYYQIPIRSIDVHKTAFSILGQKYEYLRMPVGLKCAPFIFQRALQYCLGHLKFVFIYLDDILIFSDSETEHLEHLSTVFKSLRKHNISINYDKCVFNKP